MSLGETIHATCVAIDGQAVLLTGPSESGKSDLALRLIDRGATLVSDDYTIVRRVAGRLLALVDPAATWTPTGPTAAPAAGPAARAPARCWWPRR